MASISVIIPVYGTEHFIARCLDSVFSQTFTDFEIVVVNDCTRDNAMKIVAQYASKYNKFKLVQHECNKGLMVARKSGYRSASGKYIVFLDSDDTLPSHALEKLYSEMSKSGNKIVSGGYKYIYDDERREDRQPAITGSFNSKEALELCLQGKINHNLAFAIFDRALFDKEFITIPNQTNGEDLILFYQLVKEAGTIKVIPDLVYNYYQNVASSSNSAPTTAKLLQWAKAQNFKYEFCTGLNIDKKIILKNIIDKVARWPEVKNGKEVYKELHKDIRSEINPISFFRYLPTAKAVYCTLLAFIPKLAFTLSNLKRLK